MNDKILYLHGYTEFNPMPRVKSQDLNNVPSLRLKEMDKFLREAFLRDDGDNITTEDAMAIAIADFREKALLIARHLNVRDCSQLIVEIGREMHKIARGNS